MTDEEKDLCTGCSCALNDGDIFFSREVGKVMPDSYSMLPLLEPGTGDGVYCKNCAKTVLGMTADEVANAEKAIEAHVIAMASPDN